MLQDNHIAKLLDMEGVILTDVVQTGDGIILHIELSRRPTPCPACNTITDQVHDYRIQKVKDSPIHGKPVLWYYGKRRYRCPCCQKRFYETNNLLPKGHRLTIDWPHIA